MYRKKKWQKNLPGALPQVEFLMRSNEILAGNGFTRRNTIVGVSVCREEPACFLVEEIRKLWGKVVDFSSLSGMPFVGKTGFLKLQKYAPHTPGGSRVLYMAFPHIGENAGGDRGMYAHQEGGKAYPACSGLVEFQKELVGGSTCWEIDPDDLEESLLKRRLFGSMKYGGGSDFVTLTKLAYTIILNDVERLASLTYGNSESHYAVVTGIQLNGPGQQNYIWPGDMYEVTHGQRTPLSLA